MSGVLLAYYKMNKYTEELAGIKSVKKAMSMFLLDVGGPLSFSVMIDSRKVIRDFIKRNNEISSIMDYPVALVLLNY